MSLRDEAIDVMYRADGERVGERVYVAKALDALLAWLRDTNALDPNDGMPVRATKARYLIDVLGDDDDA